jgi:hypothetical protein
MPESWHTKLEKRLIKQFGGEPTESYGPDGTIGGRPVEVRGAKKEDRFRLNRSTHQELLEERGSYIFDDLTDNQPPRRVSARRVDSMLGSGDWHSDRGYEHRFLDVDRIF